MPSGTLLSCRPCPQHSHSVPRPLGLCLLDCFPRTVPSPGCGGVCRGTRALSARELLIFQWAHGSASGWVVLLSCQPTGELKLFSRLAKEGFFHPANTTGGSEPSAASPPGDSSPSGGWFFLRLQSGGHIRCPWELRVPWGELQGPSAGESPSAGAQAVPAAGGRNSCCLRGKAWQRFPRE